MEPFLEKQKTAVRAVVTGGMGGVGQAVVRELAQAGVIVSVWYHTTPLEIVRDFLGSLPGVGHSAQAVDLANISAVEKAIETECAQGLDIVVHAAVGKINRQTILRTNVAQLQECLQRDVLGSFVLLTKAASFFKQQKRGELYIITTAALEKTDAIPAMSAYLVAKAAVREMARHLASECAAEGVSVHTIAPDFMATGLQADLPARWLEILAEKEPTGKLMEPADVAKYIGFLRSQQEAKTTGLNHVLGTGTVTSI